MAELEKNLETEESRKFWEHVESCSKEVRSWPEWKKVGWETEEVKHETRN